MPYVALAPATRESRLAGAAARWNALLQSTPELLPAVSLQRDLIRLLVDLTSQLERARLPKLSLPAKYLAAKLKGGVAILRGEPLPIPSAILTPTLFAVCDALERGGAGDAARHILNALTETRIDAGSLLAASLKRDQAAVRTSAAHFVLAPDLLWLVAELGVSPFGYVLLQRLVEAEPPASPLRRALDDWRHGFCPFCGSWPALAEVASAQRVLRCSFCALAWAPTTPCCFCCGEYGQAFVVTTPNTEQRDRRIEMCNSCGAYLKTSDVPLLSPFPLVAITDLETTSLDLAAMEQGYSRPPMKELGKTL